jgi:hypothetical protein
MGSKPREVKYRLADVCSKRGCNGTVAYPDQSMVFDGTQGECESCGRVHVAVAFDDGLMRSVHDRAEDRAKQRAESRGLRR